MLIELMIVVAIIGILAAIAIPSYQDYSIRAQVSEGLTMAGTAKAAVAEYCLHTGNLASSNDSAGLTASTDIKGRFVKQIAVMSRTCFDNKLSSRRSGFLIRSQCQLDTAGLAKTSAVPFV